ncbi:MAG TPA: malonyl-[acyl-carrier protein] O-methyltransferase BioC [Xanthomonadales bacterium]|nr:malonyl-[acyl-carrier protein] O-methyltransferase BioC [Xanthomonadales bacterium]
MTRIFDRRAQDRNRARFANPPPARPLQAEIESRLLESLVYLDDRVPKTVLDVGAGSGTAAQALTRRWPKALVVALDRARIPTRPPGKRGWWPFRAVPARLCADARFLPLADGSIEVLAANLCLQEIDDLTATLAEFRRVLSPGGLLLVSLFGPETLRELREALLDIGAGDRRVHPFPSIQAVGASVQAAGFRDPVLDRDMLSVAHPSVRHLCDEIRQHGASNALADRPRGLFGRNRPSALEQAYPARRADGHVLSTWEAIYVLAWAPAAGTARTEAGVRIAAVPVADIPIRRRRS